MAYQLPTRIWQHIFLHVDNLASSSQVSCLFHALTQDPAFRTMYFLMRSNKLQLFQHVYKRHPKLLTVEQIYSFLDFGVVLPKYFVETVYRNMKLYPANSKLHIPEQALEYLVAKGRSFYKEGLALEGTIQVEEWHESRSQTDSSPSFSNSKMRDSGFQEFSDDGMLCSRVYDDHTVFNSCFDEALNDTATHLASPRYETPILMVPDCDVNPWVNTKIDIDRLTYIVYYNHYYPGLQDDQSFNSSSRLFRQIYRLWKEGFVNLVNHLVKYSGCDYAEWLNDPDFNEKGSCSRPFPNGIRMSNYLLFIYLQKNPLVEKLDILFPKLESLLLAMNQDKETLLKETLSLLFQYPDIDGGASIRQADAIMQYYRLEDETVIEALMSQSNDFESNGFIEKGQITMAGTYYKTKYGAEWGGSKMSLWQLVASRFGVTHQATLACMNDLVVGGFGYSQKKSNVFQWMFPAYIRTVHEANLCTQDPTADARGRDCLVAMLEAGAQPEPTVFASVLSSISQTKMILGRHIQFFAVVENMLLNLKLPSGHTYKFNIQDPFQHSNACISPVIDCNLEDDEMEIYRTISSHISWLSVFHSDCLEKDEFRIVSQYEKSQKSSFRFFSKPRRKPLNDPLASIARLYDSVKLLFTFIKSGRGKEPCAFNAWLKELRTCI